MYTKNWDKNKWQEMCSTFMELYPPDRLFEQYRTNPVMKLKIYEFMLWMRAVEALEKLAKIK